ncbi:TonB-dependent receptor plug domain-containing protein [Luteimonas kalidii]|uniref:TonB-dependent receptor n=1 Tax=Luteimonas kalidii TaxID=3042025 RepID=A0ABT6JQW5_9GAMM|nr:TonB-dependent receptor [Luteimonas kalidii]MDH5833062.1 TonB-dependent receptor [Luteimonas kalidii]
MSRHPLFLALLAASSAAVPAFAQQASTETARTLDTLIVTGTRTADRTVAESQSPIDIITPEALQATGTTELATALSRTVPSLNFPRPAITDGTDAVRPAQLRGLAPDQVLVLVNGKRRHTTALINLNGSQGRGSSPVDLNAIPVSSIQRVEVLRDGAAAQYGSDAIAGVINVVLKGSREGGSVLGRYGRMSAGDGAQWNLGADTGIALGESGFLHLAAQGGDQDNTNRAKPYNGVVEQRYGDPEIESGAFSYNTEYSPAEGITFYSFGSYSERDVLSNGYFRWRGDNRNNVAIYPDGFLPQIHNVSEDRAFVAGLRGFTAGGWNIDLSYNHGLNHLTFDIENTHNRSLGDSSPTQFYAGALETTQNVLNLDVNRAFDVGWLAYPLNVAFGAEWRGEKFNLSPGEPGSYADTGLMIPERDANGELTGEMIRAAGGSQVFAGFKPVDAGYFNRESYSVYLDLEADVTDRFSIGLAARGEDYSDFGSTSTGKLSARYAFTDAIALRATASTGFRAPSLQQQYFQSTATNFIDGVPFDIVTFRVTNPAAIALGAEPLRPEESTNLGLGLVMQPIDNLYVTVDAYRIDIDDRVYLSENLTGPVGDYLAAEYGIFGVQGGRYFTNALDTRTRGIDIVGSYRWEFDASNLAATAGYNRNKTTISRIAPNPAALEEVADEYGVVLNRIGRVEQGRVTDGTPRDRFFLNGIWTLGNFSVDATTTRWGEFTNFGTATDGSGDQTYGAEWTLDLAFNYRVQDWTFTLGGDNVFDAYPDQSLAGAGGRAYLPYSTQSPFGFNGAFVYGKVGYRW